jgi:hypothetical protein
MNGNFTLERHVRIYDDGTGDYIHVGPDSDGLDLIEVRQHDGGKEVARITMQPVQAKLLIEALQAALTPLITQKES